MYGVIPKFPHTASKWCSLQLRYKLNLNILSIRLLLFRCMWQVKRKSEIYNILCGKHNEKKAICYTKMTVGSKGIHSSEILRTVNWQLSYGSFGTNYWSQLQESHCLTL
jgi:hypothetical protein